MRYINADLAIKKILNDKDKLFALKNNCITLTDDEVDGCQNYVYDRILNLLNTQPTADVKKVVHAEWDDKGIIKDYPSQGIDKYHMLICSKCGNVHRQRMWCYDNKPINSNFCPNCGATMDLKAGATYDNIVKL